MFLISFTLVLLESHCFVWHTGLASLFTMLQWCHARADFLAMARACSSWALPRSGLKKKHFSIFKALFSSQGSSPSYAWWHLPHHLWLWSKCIWVHSPAWEPTGTEVPLCTPLNSAPSWKSDRVPFAPCNGPSGTGWEDRDWLGARLG